MMRLIRWLHCQSLKAWNPAGNDQRVICLTHIVLHSLTMCQKAVRGGTVFTTTKAMLTVTWHGVNCGMNTSAATTTVTVGNLSPFAHTTTTTMMTGRWTPTS